MSPFHYLLLEPERCFIASGKHKNRFTLKEQFTSEQLLFPSLEHVKEWPEIYKPLIGLKIEWYLTRQNASHSCSTRYSVLIDMQTVDLDFCFTLRHTTSRSISVFLNFCLVDT